jgi:uncharacterized protein
MHRNCSRRCFRGSRVARKSGFVLNYQHTGALVDHMTQSLSRGTQIEMRRALLEGELARWLPLLIAHEQPEKIILFGSFPAGQINEWSDLDLVLVKHTAAPFLDRIRQVLVLLQPEVGVDMLVYTPQEYEQLIGERAFVREEIAAKGKVIYERHP